jgi:HAD superfamily hydrolase (TIGR01490 family)
VRLHIFDVDFTIVRCSTVRAFIARGLADGLVGLSIAVYAPLIFLRHGRSGFADFDAGKVYPFLKGIGRGELEDLAARLFEESLKPRIDGEIAGRIAAARAAGEGTLIASSSFRTILEPLAFHLGVAEVLANELEYAGGITTGRIAGRPVFGEGKRSRVLEYLEERRIAPTDCSFYSDSWRDLPLLREVGRPVAVNPGSRLRRIARASGWEVLSA